MAERRMAGEPLGTSRRMVAVGSAIALILGAFGACSSDETGGPGPGSGGDGGAVASGGNGGGTTSSGTGGGSSSVDDDGDGYSEDDGDCNDGDPNVHPGAEEVCGDGIDNNCNGAQDDSEIDGDGDGFGPCQGDCDDADPDVHPAAPEIPDDGIDNNCDGITDADFDSDGYTEDDGDCNDADPDVHPGALESCFDGVDNDCNGYIDDQEPDVDNDGYGPCSGDCAEGDPAIGPDQPEIDGDGIDNNCDNLVDEDIDGDGWTTANGDCNDADPAVNPAVLEVCGDGVDNDCDGTTDTDCLSPCELAEIFGSSVGCVFYAVDLNNDPVENYDTQPYAVVVSNTDPASTANVEVQTRQGGVWTMVQSAQVAPGSLNQFDLPDRHVNYTNVNLAGAYRVVSDLPIIAYQFQPVNGQSSYTSDASLLLPTSALDKYYYVPGWGGTSYGDAQIVIVAAEDGTTITVTPAQNTEAGGGIPALTAGVAYTFPSTFDAGDYIQLEAEGFSGTYVTADRPVAVFSAHWCANIPSMGCCCDHLEEQVVGLQTWGQTYVAARFPVRGTTVEPTQWHILASQDDTNITFVAHPSVTGLPGGAQNLNAGQELYLQVGGSQSDPGDFVILADKPVLVMEYLSSSFAVSGVSTAQSADPAMSQVVPVEQFLDNYVVLVPSEWIYDWMVITKPVGATVNIDSTPIPQGDFVVIDDGQNPPEWVVARVAVTDGVHALDGDAPFGVVVLGYDAYDSYAYPGGLDQQIINPIN